jgi:hypothetical protein
MPASLSCPPHSAAEAALGAKERELRATREELGARDVALRDQVQQVSTLSQTTCFCFELFIQSFLAESKNT